MQIAFNDISNKIQSSTVIGTTNVSAPFIANLMATSSQVSGLFTAIRKTIIASLIIALVGSGITILIGLPAILFRGSKLVVYALVFSTSLACTFQLFAAILATALVRVVGTVVSSIGEGLGLSIEQGGKLLLFAWLAWVFVGLAALYWWAVWFVEVRTWSFVKRARTRQERENWRDAVAAMREDWRGRKSLAGSTVREEK
jgi:hypothetical protein